MNKKLISLIIFIFMPILLVTGFSSWIIVGEKSETVGITPISTNVCYINTNTSGNQYTRIEKALEVATAGDTVYVYPGLKASDNSTSLEIRIYKDCTIKSGVTLCLPYSGTTHYTTTFGTSSSLADSSLTNVNTNRQTLVVLSEGVKMTIEYGGNLKIGGIFGNSNGSTGLAGGTNGSYCELAMEKNSLIESSGLIECYGYIKEYDEIDNKSMINLIKGTMKIPFVIYDYKGGTNTTEINEKGICPFNEFDMANIQTKVRVHSDAKVIGEGRITVSSLNSISSGLGNIAQSVSIIASDENDNAFILKSGYVDIKYTPKTKGLTLPDDSGSSYTTFYLNGDLSIGTIRITKSISFFSIDIDTSTVFFPMSYRFRFEINEGSIITTDKKVKFMQGSSIIIDKGATINIDNQVIFYPSSYTDTSTADWSYPDGKETAKLMNNGTVNITSNGILAGDIETEVNNAVLSVYSALNTSTNSFKISCDDGSTTDTITSCSVEMTGNIGGVESTLFTETPAVYVSSTYDQTNNLKTWNKFETNFKLNYKKIYTNEFDKYIADLSGDYTDHGYISELSIEDSNDYGTLDKVTINSVEYNFVGWFFDDECQDALIDNTVYGAQLLNYADINNSVTLYAKWTSKALVQIKHYGSVASDSSSLNTSAQYGSIIKQLAGTKFNTYDKLPDYYSLSTTTEGAAIGMSNDKRTWKTFNCWEITLHNADGTTKTTSVSASKSYTIPSEFDGTLIELKPVYIETYSEYKVTIQGDVDSSHVSISGLTGYSNAAGDYWAVSGNEFTISVTGEKGFSGGDTICELENATFKEDGSSKITGKYSFLGGSTASGTIEMKAYGIKIKITQT